MIALGQFDHLGGSPQMIYLEGLQPPRKVVESKRSAPQMRLQVSIPSSNAKPSPLTEGNTPQSESPETPASVTSPIAGVVDLTKSVTTTSKYAVAHGGLSDIYLGEWHRTENEAEAGEMKVVVVAIKLLRILARKDQDGVRARKRLNREVYVWHRLDHPNVVKLFGTSYHMSGRPAMVMQWYENGSAAEYLARKNPNADRLQLILDVAHGLAYLHTHKPPIVHADLKGNNVLITDEGRAALSDFGLSKVVEDLGRPTGYTLSNPDVGPLRWQAPEFLENDEEPAMLTSDVWSFGCTAYELLTSSIPYAHRIRDAQVIMDMQKRIKPPGPSDVKLLSFDCRVRSLLDSCWSFSPTERPHMTDIRAQLEAIYAS
jgi:serine/threonine protein kinase